MQFRRRRLHDSKRFLVGTHRLRDPGETFTLVEPFLDSAGVTRIADVTGLDRVGVPTTLVIRPNSQTIACSSGKGLTISQAYTSGVMEAIELHAAETVELPTIQASYESLATEYDVPAVENLPLRRWNVFSTTWAIPWSLGWDVIGRRETPVPSAIVGMSRRSAFVTNVGAFHVTSNGLGSGNSLLEAIVAALYEVIERDAIACTYAAAAHRPIPILHRVELETNPLVASVLEMCDRAGVEITVYDCTVDTAVPTYNALAHDKVDRGVAVVKGSGTHLDPEIAILRAVTEALQARLNFIAGSRDDVFRSAFARSRTDWQRAVVAIARERDESPHAARRHSEAHSSFEEDTHLLLARVRSTGLDQVIVFDITPENFPISVVRVIVPGFEGYQHHGFQPGPRAVAASVPD